MKSRQSHLVANHIKSKLGRMVIAGKTRNTCMAINTMRNYQYYALVYVLDGTCHYTDEDNRNFTCKAGDLFFVFPGLRHNYRPHVESGEYWGSVYISFEGASFEYWVKHALISPNAMPISLTPINYWSQRITNIFQSEVIETQEDSIRQVAQLQLLLADILINHKEQSISRHENHWLTQAKQLIMENTSSPPDYHAIAQQLGCSYETFRKRFTALANLSPNRYRTQEIIQEASKLLINHPYSNAEIADQLGFASEYHFCKRFKEITGTSPQQFRKMVQQS